MSLHPEWQSFVSQNPNISHDDNRRNGWFLASPEGQRLTTGVVTEHVSAPGRDGYPIPLRVYRREGNDTPDAIVLFFHSGAFLSGSLETEDLSCRIMALDANVTVVSVEYRLCPEYAYPIPIHDAWDAFQHVISNLASFTKLDGGPVKMVIAGTSSGGQLAGIVSQKARTWLSMSENTELAQRINLCGVLLRAPVTVRATDQQYVPSRFRDLHRSWTAECETPRLTLEELKAAHDAFGVPMEERTSWEAYPLWGQFEGLPRTYVQVCEVDIIRDDAICYLQGLQNAGVEVKHSFYKNLPHVFWIYAPALDITKQAQQDCIEGLRWILEPSATDA